MKRNFLYIALAALMAPSLVSAQNPDRWQQIYPDMEFSTAGRISAEVDKKLATGLHLSVSGEVRGEDNFTKLDRFQGTVDLSYKACPYFKVGVGYAFMSLWKVKSVEPEDMEDYLTGKWVPEGNYDSVNGLDKFWDIRHRAYLDLTGMYKVGEWHFSLRERVQLTHKTRDINTFQAPLNDIVLRSRFKVSYASRTAPLEPYMYVEMRNPLNGVKYSNRIAPFVIGDNVRYSDVYVGRIRTSIGTEWLINARNSFDFYILGDYCYDKKFDAFRTEDHAGAKQHDAGELKSITYRKAFILSVGIGYKYEF